ncbi:MAG: sulfurtransferase [Chloroflexia bacterium]|nr:sulfurtransferase [Chloroflexia bacterium]
MPALSSPIVSADWLTARLGDPDLLVADVRAPDAYRAGHIPGAIHADFSVLRLSSSAPEAIAAWTDRLQTVVDALGFGPERTVVLYEDISGTMAAYGVWLLDAAGLGNGAMLDGGLNRWRTSRHPLATGNVPPRPTSGAVTPETSVIATAEGILDSLNGSGEAVNLVDSRAAHEFAMGAIPGAVNVEWSRHLDASGAFKPIDDLRAIYAETGLSTSEPVASYCAAGIRAANTYVVLKALGYDAARNYAPSWGEWGTRPDTPVERHR